MMTVCITRKIPHRQRGVRQVSGIARASPRRPRGLHAAAAGLAHVTVRRAASTTGEPVTGQGGTAGLSAADAGQGRRCGKSGRPRAVRGLARGQDERQRTAFTVGGKVDLTGLPAPGTSEKRGLQPESAPAPDASPLFPRGTGFNVLPVSFFEAAPFDPVFSSSAAAFSRAVRTCSPRCIPAASW